MSIEWFIRFGDIPGVTYTTPVGINRSKLKNASARPEVFAYGDNQQTLHWPMKGGSTSASPAATRLQDVDLSTKPTASVLRYLDETLELPGQPQDYHFVIQSVLEALWSRRQREPAVLETTERVAWLDMDLIRARPDTITNEYVAAHDGQPRFFQVNAFARLIKLYEREGALWEALEVAELAARFEQHEAKREELAGRLAALAAEAT